MAPARGILTDLVRHLGGLLVRDGLGSPEEIEAVKGALRLGRAHVSAPVKDREPSLVELARTLWNASAVRCPEPALETDENARIARADHSNRRSRVLLALQASHIIRSWEEGQSGDAYQISPRRRRLRTPVHGTYRPTTVSACIVLGPPRRTLEECLQSLVGVVDEVVILQTDEAEHRLPALSAALGLPVRIERVARFGGDFSAARNRTIDTATGDYVLVIDDDERLIGGERLRELLNTRVADALVLPILNLEPEAGVIGQANVRVFRRTPEHRFEGPLHEYVTVPVGRATFVDRPYLIHFGYSDAREVAHRVKQRNRLWTAAHLNSGDVHPHLRGVHLRDVLSEEGMLGLPDAVAHFHRDVIEAGRWELFLTWSEVWAEACARLKLGVELRLDASSVLRGPADVRRFTFTRRGDLEAFVSWWSSHAGRRLPEERRPRAQRDPAQPDAPRRGGAPPRACDRMGEEGDPGGTTRRGPQQPVTSVETTPFKGQ